MNREKLPEQEPLWIGAVKPNIGHSEAASGLSAVIKAVLALERGIIPPTRGVAKLNSKSMLLILSKDFPKLTIEILFVSRLERLEDSRCHRAHSIS